MAFFGFLPREKDSVTNTFSANSLRYSLIYSLAICLFYNKNEAEAIISQRLESQIGKVAVKFDYVSVLPAGKNGKVKAVISNVVK